MRTSSGWVKKNTQEDNTLVPLDSVASKNLFTVLVFANDLI